MGAFGLSGLASGIDTAGIVDKLMQLEQQPKLRLQLRQKTEEARKQALADIQARLKSLRTAAADLKSVGLWSDTQTVGSTNSALVGVKRVGGATPGGYALEVTQLATAPRATFSGFTSPTADGTLSVTFGSTTTSVAVKAGDTLDDVIARINTNGDLKVSAVKVGSDLVVSSDVTGQVAAPQLSATASPGIFTGTAATNGRDAAYTINGDARTSTSNTVSDAVAGLELSLLGITGSVPVTVNVGTPGVDASAIKVKVKAFVEQYNSTADLIRSKLTEQKVAKPTKDADYLKGVLNGDAELTGLLARLRQTVSDEDDIGAGAGLNQLTDLGVTTGATTGGGSFSKDAVNGRLAFDEATFDAAFASNPSGVRKLLGGMASTGTGFAQRVERLLGPVLDTGGSMTGRLEASDGALKRLRDQIDDMDGRLALKEARFKRQFAAMEAALSSSQSQQQWLAGQIASLG
jgi:flagellar hook-associated protein 2